MLLSGIAGWYVARSYRVSAAGAEAILYICPMHPRYTSDRPGDCPSCGMRLVPASAEKKEFTRDEAGDSLPSAALSISAEKQQLIGVRIAAVEKAPVDSRFRTIGRVVPDDTKIVRITTADGWVEEVYSGSADTVVHKDQLLAKFYSKDAISAQLSYLYNMDLPENLSKNRQDKSAAYILYKSADKELHSLGMSDHQMKEIRQTGQAVTEIELRAPMTGYVLARNICSGMKIERGTELYRIADLGRIWILADLYENEASHFRPGMEAKVTLPQNGKIFRARVSNVLPQFDPATRTLKVRLETDNPGYVLRPDMFVDVEIPVHKQSTIAVPSEAILYTGGAKRVFVELGNGYFAPREIETGARFADKTEILRGLTEGEQIVISGAFLIDSESRMKPSTAKSGMTVAKTTQAKDPVCGMDVDTSAPDAIKTKYGGKTHYFCSPKCKKDFEANPAKYIHETMTAQDMNRTQSHP
jgi:membrane fusion protein, copper/silver efflux system